MSPSIHSEPGRPVGAGQSFSRHRLAVASLVLALVANLSVAQTPGRSAGSLPSLGDNSELSAAAERRIGERIAASIYRDPDNIDDPVLEDYLQSIWQPLMAAARARGELSAELDERFAWEVFLIRNGTVNAFALPGGYFGVHLGLIAVVSSPDELAAVLGHEISHVTQRHISRLMTQQAQQAPWVIAAMILGALAASKNPNAANAAIVGGQAVAAQGQLNFSRDMEREADRVGFGIMTDAGFDSRGVAAMFDKLQQAGRLNDSGSFPYLRSHPLTTARIAEAQARVQLAWAARPSNAAGKGDGKARVLHAMMAARARILALPGVDGLRAMVAEAQPRAPVSAVQALQLPAPAANVRESATLYAGSLAAAQLRDFAAARTLLGRLQTLNADNQRASHAVELLSIEIDLLAGTVPSSAATARIALTSSRVDVMMQSRSLMAAGRALEVAERLQTWVAAHPRDASAWQLLAVAYGQQNLSVRSIRADAESRAAQLDFSGALDRLKAAQALMRSQPGSTDYVEGSILDTRTRQIALLLKNQTEQDKVDR